MNRYKYGFDRCKTFVEVCQRKSTLSKLLHPDRGGDALLFGEMTAEARERIDELSEQPLGGKKGDGRNAVEDKPDIITELLNTVLQSNALKRKITDIVVDSLYGTLLKK